MADNIRFMYDDGTTFTTKCSEVKKKKIFFCEYKLFLL